MGRDDVQQVRVKALEIMTILSKLRQRDCLCAEMPSYVWSPLHKGLLAKQLPGLPRPEKHGRTNHWKWDCFILLGKGRGLWALKISALQVKQMSGTIVGIENSANGVFPRGIDTHWITENRVLWNEKHRSAEQCELVYEVSWILEIGAWRRFLRSQRFMESVR